MARFGAPWTFRYVLAFYPNRSNPFGISSVSDFRTVSRPRGRRRATGLRTVVIMAIEEYEWQRHYEAAILETDRSRLPSLINAAQVAIEARVEELRVNHGGTTAEQQAIADALAGLRVLRKECLEPCQPQQQASLPTSVKKRDSTGQSSSS